MSIEKRLDSAIRDIPDFPKPGSLFKDITPVLQDPALCRDVIDEFYRHFQGLRIDVIVGVESRGFLFGMLLAQKFNVPFVPVRKVGKLPHKTVSYSYELEYGSASVEIHEDAIRPGACALIHDDLLATGGTAAAASELVQMLGGRVAGFTFLVGLEFLNGRNVLRKYSDNIVSLINFN
jgi:adenine phosphoribosyltransferase